MSLNFSYDAKIKRYKTPLPPKTKILRQRVVLAIRLLKNSPLKVKS